MSDNILVDQQLAEAAQVKQFLDSPVWAWLKTRLDTKRAALMAKLGVVGTKRDDRMMLLGQLFQVTEILERPAMLLDLAERQAKIVQEQPVERERDLPAQRYLPGVI